MRIKNLQDAIFAFLIITDGSILTTQAQEIARICPPEYGLEGTTNKCYRVFEKRQTWDDARRHCQLEGGDLPIIQDFGVNYVTSRLMLKPGHVIKSAWIGLREVGDNQTLTWVNDDPLGYSPWSTGDPNGPNGRDCVGKFPNYLWFDVACTYLMSYICQRPLLVNPMCPHAEMSSARNDKSKCLALTKTSRSYNGARKMCGVSGGDLVSITDADTKDLVIGLIHPTRNKVARYWIGLRNPYMVRTRPYQWLDGTYLNKSDPTVVFSYKLNEYCAILQFDHGKYIYNDYDGIYEIPSICEKNMTKAFPLFECPHGFATNVGTDNSVSCLKFQNHNPKNVTDAYDDCLRMDARLLTLPQPKFDYDSITARNLIILGSLYWGGFDPCEQFDFLYKHSTTMPCSDTFNYICQHWGTISAMVDLKELAGMGDDFNEVVWNDGTKSITSFMTDFCQSPMEAGVAKLQNWTSVNIVLSTGCINPDSQYECCSAVTLSNPRLLAQYAEIEITITLDKWNCLCVVDTMTYGPTTTAINTNEESWHRQTTENVIMFEPTMDYSTPFDLGTNDSNPFEFGTDNSTPFELGTDNSTPFEETMDYSTPFEATIDYATTDKPPTNGSTTVEPDTSEPIRQETFDLLRNMTTPKNGSTTTATTTNNLCPCPCDSMKFDLNPTPEVLSQMISKIQSDLKVDTEKLSSKRNKKESAVDSRRESKAMGYVGIVMCLVPLCLMVAFDISRIFQAIQWK